MHRAGDRLAVRSAPDRPRRHRQLSYTTNTVTATLGGQAAQVQFAGLAPGFVGLYQVNVIVPSGLTPGSAVPLVLTDTNASSPAVTAAIQ